jgi:hypothetical protein
MVYHHSTWSELIRWVYCLFLTGVKEPNTELNTLFPSLSIILSVSTNNFSQDHEFVQYLSQQRKISTTLVGDTIIISISGLITNL